MKMFLILMAILGTIVPVLLFIDYFLSNGFAVDHIVASLFPNPLASGFTADILISIFVFLVWTYFELKHELKKWLLLLLCSGSVGLSLSLPVYFLMRLHTQEQSA